MNQTENIGTPAPTAPRSSSNQDTDGLLSRVFTDVTGLVQSELALAKSEIHHSIDDAKKGAAGLAVGVAVLVPGVMLLIASVALMLEAFTDLSLWSSTLIVGGVISAIGFALLSSGKNKLSVDNLAPTRTQTALENDANLVKRKLS